jgi:hypothetical protein
MIYSVVGTEKWLRRCADSKGYGYLADLIRNNKVLAGCLEYARTMLMEIKQ